ncbi:hypothetical protein M422DRAFT_45708 [Sphaerobolus stellatus SS14]|nr:hypothetical protein M422DRAFT_45708 [Sphaerobolus stellatus SS14]
MRSPTTPSSSYHSWEADIRRKAFSEGREIARNGVALGLWYNFDSGSVWNPNIRNWPLRENGVRFLPEEFPEACAIHNIPNSKCLCPTQDPNPIHDHHDDTLWFRVCSTQGEYYGRIVAGCRRITKGCGLLFVLDEVYRHPDLACTVFPRRSVRGPGLPRFNPHGTTIKRTEVFVPPGSTVPPPPAAGSVSTPTPTSAHVAASSPPTIPVHRLSPAFAQTVHQHSVAAFPPYGYPYNLPYGMPIPHPYSMPCNPGYPGQYGVPGGITPIASASTSFAPQQTPSPLGSSNKGKRPAEFPVDNAPPTKVTRPSPDSPSPFLPDRKGKEIAPACHRSAGRIPADPYVISDSEDDDGGAPPSPTPAPRHPQPSHQASEADLPPRYSTLPPAKLRQGASTSAAPAQSGKRLRRNYDPSERYFGDLLGLLEPVDLPMLAVRNSDVPLLTEDQQAFYADNLSRDGVDSNVFNMLVDRCNCSRYFFRTYLHQVHGPSCVHWYHVVKGRAQRPLPPAAAETVASYHTYHPPPTSQVSTTATPNPAPSSISPLAKVTVAHTSPPTATSTPATPVLILSKPVLNTSRGSCMELDDALTLDMSAVGSPSTSDLASSGSLGGSSVSISGTSITAEDVAAFFADVADNPNLSDDSI